MHKSSSSKIYSLYQGKYISSSSIFFTLYCSNIQIVLFLYFLSKSCNLFFPFCVINLLTSPSVYIYSKSSQYENHFAILEYEYPNLNIALIVSLLLIKSNNLYITNSSISIHQLLHYSFLQMVLHITFHLVYLHANKMEKYYSVFLSSILILPTLYTLNIILF